MKPHLTTISLALAGFLACCGATQCSRSSDASSPAPPVKIEAAEDSSLVEAHDPGRFPLVKVEARRLPDELRLNGVVAPDVARTVHVNSLSGGRVREIRAKLGDDVRQGQVLLVLHSPDLETAMAAYRKAQADQELARKALDREQSLYGHGAVPAKDLEQAQNDSRKADVDVQTAAEQIRLLGADVDRLSAVIEVKSPIAGAIVEQNTAGGEAVKSLDNAPSLFTIADLDRVWVLADVYENNLAEVHMGDTAEVTLNAYPDQPLAGHVSNISQVLDPATRAAKLRVDLDNHRRLMRPGMFATVKFVSRRLRERAVVPASAILRLHDRDWVFRPAGGNRFRRTEVHAGPASEAGLEEILSGLAPGDEVVADALEFSGAVEEP